MGVDRTDYLMWAIDVGFDAVGYDDFDAEIEGAEGRRFDMVYDGMGGKYALVGKIIASSDPDEGIEMVKIDNKAMAFDRSALADSASEAFGKALSPSDFSLILFSHFS